MAKHSASAASFLEDYQAAGKRLSATLRDYLGDPSEDHLHELRSALRRMNVLLRLLPKDTRAEGSVRAYQKRCRKSLKLTSPIRDVDLLVARLGSPKTDRGLSSMIRKAASRRRKLVKDSMRASWKLFELPTPKFEPGDLAGINVRIGEVMAKTDRNIAKLFPKVIASESRLEELHMLRKQSKKLRYIIEAVPPSERSKKVAETLRSWQDILGAVHDGDVLIDHFKREASSASVRRLLRTERIRRHAQYMKFQRIHRAEHASTRDRRKADSFFGLSIVSTSSDTINDKSRS